MRLRGSVGGGARVRRRNASAGERLASALGGRGREVEFGAVDGVYRAAEPADEAERRGDPAERHLPARPAVHVYTRGGRTRALVGALIGQHIDLLV